MPTTAEMISGLALLVACGSLYVSWSVWRSNERRQKPLVWLTLRGFENEPNWWAVTVNIDNRSAVGLLPIECRLPWSRKPVLSSYTGPLIGGAKWQLDKAVRDAPFGRSVSVVEQIVGLLPGENGAMTAIVKTDARRIRLELICTTIEANPRKMVFPASATIPTTQV